MLGFRRELADRHVFDHAPAQRADGLVGHGGAPVLGEVVGTPRSQDRTLPPATGVDNYASRAAGTLPRERFSPVPSRPGEFHPEPLTDPDLTLSRHPARATTRRLPPSIEHRVPPVAG